MKYLKVIKACELFYALAMPIEGIADVKIDNSGMRDESFEIVRKQRDANMKMRPIEIAVYPGESPILSDGRHRLAVAQERGDKTIDAIVRYYDDEANTIKLEKITLPI